MSRGGKREGAGRPRSADPTNPVIKRTIGLRRSEWHEFDQVRGELSNPAMLRMVLGLTRGRGK